MIEAFLNGARDVAMATIDGFLPFDNPFLDSGAYQDSKALIYSRMFGNWSRNLLLSATVLRAMRGPISAGGGQRYVSRWGDTSLQPGSFVQLSKANRFNYTMTGKWHPSGDNLVAPFRPAGQYVVPKSNLSWPKGGEALKGVLGQRIYTGP